MERDTIKLGKQASCIARLHIESIPDIHCAFQMLSPPDPPVGLHHRHPLSVTALELMIHHYEIQQP